MASSISTLSDLSSFSVADQALVSVLLEAGQAHVFEKWVPGADAEKKSAFFATVRSLEANYPGGIAAYVKNAKELLRSSAAGENPFEGMRPEVREGRERGRGGRRGKTKQALSESIEVGPPRRAIAKSDKRHPRALRSLTLLARARSSR